MGFLVFVLLSLLWNGVGGNINSAQLSTIIGSDTNENINSGERLHYYAVIKHDNAASKLDAQETHLKLYLPFYVTFGKPLQKDPAVELLTSNNALIIKIASLAIGKQVNVTFDLIFDETSSLPTGHHYIVIPFQLYWRDADNGGGKKHSSPLATYSKSIVVPGCSASVGVGDHRVKDHQLTATSSYPQSRATQAKESLDGWCSIIGDVNQHIEVSFNKKTKITKITTWGRRSKGFWVSKYSLEYGDTVNDQQAYQENGVIKVFEGNSDTVNAVSHWLSNPVTANIIRIKPLEWNSAICLRFELYGCQLKNTKDNCIDAVGLEDGRITDMALDDSVTDDPMSLPKNARLNKIVEMFPFGWLASSAREGDWLQIDMGSIHKLTKVALQGGYSSSGASPFFVTSFMITYSNNSLEWKNLMENGQTKIFSGTNDGVIAASPNYFYLPSPVYSRYIRFIPKGYVGMRCMRVEIYGCMSEPQPRPNKGTREEFGRRMVLFNRLNNMIFICMYNGDTRRSCCRWTINGTYWKGLSSDIICVIAYKKSKLYGLDRYLQYSISDDNGENWASISNSEWQRAGNSAGGNVVHANKIPDLLVEPNPTANLTWTGKNKISWGASARGIHTKNVKETAWKLVATWKCCGQ